jgi:predicted class III extradiol MEMO1 family dioxygenase
MNIILIPHASHEFASSARSSVFNLITSHITKIYYLATIHGRIHSSTSSVFVSIYDEEVMPSWMTTEKNQFPMAVLEEHSYKWVEPELRSAFPSATHCVLFPYFPSSDVGSSSSSSDAHEVAKWLVDTHGHEPNTLLIATTDLIHYGPNYSPMLLPFPQQVGKIKLEEPLLNALINSDIDMLNRAFELVPFVADSPHVLAVLVRIVNMMRFKGRIIDYYDSSSISNPLQGHMIDDLDKYTISWNNIEEFVSYVAMIFTTGDAMAMTMSPNRFDIMQAIGAVRSVIAFSVFSVNKLLTTRDIFPSWSIWVDVTTFGVFVGTTVAEEINCSYGQFPDDDALTLADKIVEAARHCPSDAKDRWQIPYTKKDMETLGRVKFKIELLPPLSEWKFIKAIDLPNVTRTGTGTAFGVKLDIPGIGSATFLPSVLNEFENISSYLDALSRKLGGKNGDWKQTDAIAGIYYTIAFYWDSFSQNIEII